jgi:ubiquinone/menaquinone biosynthesis C-methylase UbiE
MFLYLINLVMSIKMKNRIKYNFNLIADDYNKHHSAHNNFAKIISENFEMNNDSTLIDIGCGTGNESINLFQAFKCKVIGLEPANEMIKIGQKRSSNIDWILGSAENIPKENSSVDIITSFFSIHHFDNIDLSFQEFFRVLKPNGKIFIFTISHSQMKSSLEYKFFPDLLNADIDRVPSISILKEKLSFHNFETSKIETEYEIRKIDKKYLEMVKNLYRSGLRLLNQEQLRVGIELIENSIKNNENQIDNIKCTVLIARKQ